MLAERFRQVPRHCVRVRGQITIRRSEFAILGWQKPDCLAEEQHWRSYVNLHELRVLRPPLLPADVTRLDACRSASNGTTQRQRCVRWVTKPLGYDGAPEGQYRSAVYGNQHDWLHGASLFRRGRRTKRQEKAREHPDPLGLRQRARRPLHHNEP